VQADTLRYRLIYDAPTAGYTDWWFPAVGLVLLVVFGAALYRHHSGTPVRHVWVLYVGVPFLLLWVTIAAAATYGNYARLRDRLRAGEFTTVEGIVQDFQPSDAGDHRTERWAVMSGGRLYHYEYVPSRLTPGFRQTVVHGGPIRPGLRVRIADVDGHIARLEIAP
jgi:hypothetical protein